MHHTILTHMNAAYASRLGLTTARGSQLVAVFSATNIIGRLLSGYLGDKLGALNVNISFLAMGGASSLFMWHYATNFAELVAFVVVYGIMSATVFTLSKYPFIIIIIIIKQVTKLKLSTQSLPSLRPWQETKNTRRASHSIYLLWRSLAWAHPLPVLSRQLPPRIVSMHFKCLPAGHFSALPW